MRPVWPVVLVSIGCCRSLRGFAMLDNKAFVLRKGKPYDED